MYASTGGGYTIAHRRNFKRDGTKRPVLVCPARSHTSIYATVVGWLEHVTRQIAEKAGIPVLSGDMGGLTTHGNVAARDAVGTAKTASDATYGAKAGPVGLLASSMGALAALRYAKANPANVSSLVLIVPNVNLQDVHDVTRTDLAAEIDTAHGGAGGYNTYVSNENPSSHASSFTGFPTQIHYASDDPNFSAGVQAAFGAAIGAEVINLGAVGHTPTTVDAAAVANFFLAHA